MPVTATVQITIVVTAGAAGTITNSVTAAANERDTFLDDNTATLVTEIRANRAPISMNDAVVALEDVPLGVSVLANDSDPDGDPLSIATFTQPAHGLVTAAGGLLTYLPAQNFNGTDAFTYTASDGYASGGPATVSISVGPVNDPPTFAKGPDQTSTSSELRVTPGWATAVSPGPADEAGQALMFEATNDNPGLFTTQPAVSANGTLTYATASGASGKATVTLRLKDSGGTVNGGVDTSVAATFTIRASSLSPDCTFGSCGVVVTPIGSFAQASDIVLDSENRILAAVHATGQFVAVRYSPEGVLDSTFRGDVSNPRFGTGVVTIDISAIGASAEAIAVQTDGKILLGGHAYRSGSWYEFAIMRLNADGTLDRQFGSEGSGVAWLSSGRGADSLVDLAVQPDGRIVGVGTTGGSDVMMTRLLDDGRPDPSFGANHNGIVVDDLGGADEQLRSVLIQPDLKIVAAGASGPGTTNHKLLIVRYFPDGTRDRATVTPVPEGNGRLLAIARQPDGNIVGVGHCFPGSGGTGVNFVLARYGTDLTLDGSFGRGGLLCEDVAGSDDQARAVSIDVHGHIVVAGFAGNDGVEDFAVLKLPA